MRLKFFAVPVFDSAAAEEELNAFLAQHRVLSVDRRLVESPSATVWTICVQYVDPAQVKSEVSTPSITKKGKIDYREVLSADDFAAYMKLRELRKQIADKAGIPPYAVFNNEQLAAMVRGRMVTKTALSSLEGVGDAKLTKYGDAFLNQLRTMFADSSKNGASHAAS